jgi:SAM-dependent methyltransferase
MKYLAEFDRAECDGHQRRYALSAQWLEGLLQAGAVVYDCGRGAWPLAAMLQRCFPADLRTTGEQDLRYEFATIPGGVADGVICTEVIEHLKDRGEDDPTTFTYSGIANLVGECFRILKPGGWLFLTTPNLASLGCLWTHLRGDAAHWYKPHVRELGPAEVRWFLERAGFCIVRFEGVDVWSTRDCPPELAALAMRLAPAVPREDCLFVLAEKPHGDEARS